MIQDSKARTVENAEAAAVSRVMIVEMKNCISKVSMR